MPPPGALWESREEAAPLPSLDKDKKSPPKGKGEGSTCKSLAFRVKFGAFLFFFSVSLSYGKRPATAVMLSRKSMNIAVTK